MNIVRRAFTLIEVIIAAAILSSVLAIVAQSVLSGTTASEAMRTKADVVNSATGVVNA